MSEYIIAKSAHPIDYNSLFENLEFKNMIIHKMMHQDSIMIPFNEDFIQSIQDIVQIIDNEFLMREK